MNRINRATVTVGVIAILAGLLTVCAVRHHFCSQQPTTAGSDCYDCRKKRPGLAAPAGQQAQACTAPRNVPTLAPRQTPSSSLAAGTQVERDPRGQVVYVRVEAEQAGPQRN